MSTPLIDALGADSGIVCLVGAGGKKTTMYRLWAEHAGRVGLTATVMIPYFPKALRAASVVTEAEHTLPAAVTSAAREHTKVAFALRSDKRGRHGGLGPELVDRVHTEAGFEVTLVKADGARARLVKAPAPDEPRIPAGTRTVIAVVSAHAIGAPLADDIAHRVERLAAVTGLVPGEIVEPEHVARLLASEAGALQNVARASVVPLINMVDDAHHERLARSAAACALALSTRFERVVLARMSHAEAPIETVRR